MHDSTKIIRSTLTPVVAGEPLHPSPVFAAPYHTPGDPADAQYSYARSHNPTWTALERAIGQMESGEFATVHERAGKPYRANALVFASGMAACSAIFGAVLRPGDVVVLPENAYFAARQLLQGYFEQMGVVLRLAPTAKDAQGEHLEGARLLWIETSASNSDRWRSAILLRCAIRLTGRERWLRSITLQRRRSARGRLRSARIFRSPPTLSR